MPVASDRDGAALGHRPSNVPVLARHRRTMAAEARLIRQAALDQDQARKDRPFAPEHARALSAMMRKTADYAAAWRLARPPPAPARTARDHAPRPPAMVRWTAPATLHGLLLPRTAGRG